MSLLLVDLDGTIRTAKSGSVCPNGPKDQELIPGAMSALNRYQRKGYEIHGISNQGGCEAVNPETGKPYKTVKSTIAEMRYLLRICPPLRSVYFCPNYEGDGNEVVHVERPWWLVPFLGVSHEDRTDGGCHPNYWSGRGFRKPNAGMIHIAHVQYNERTISASLALENKPDERDLEPKDIIFVGDRQSDEEAAESYGCQFIWAENLLHPKPLFIGYNRVVR